MLHGTGSGHWVKQHNAKVRLCLQKELKRTSLPSLALVIKAKCTSAAAEALGKRPIINLPFMQQLIPLPPAVLISGVGIVQVQYYVYQY
jgi:hypothetical protein